MIELVPLCEIRIVRGALFDLGPTPTGHRAVGEVASLTVTGRISGSLAGGAAADWPVVGRDGVTVVDARMTIRTDDGAHVLMTYGGRCADLRTMPDVVTYVTPVFFTGDERYRWLNGIQAVGKGVIDPADPTVLTYEVHELR